MCFTAVGTICRPEVIKGELLKSFDLLNPKDYDGIILARETLHEKEMQKRVVERLRGERRSRDFIRSQNRGHGLYRI